MLYENLIGEVVGGRYKVERLIGRGGMGSIYEVSHQILGRKFAMKTLSGHLAGDPGAAARFFREADSIAKLRHPNVVDVFGWEHLADGSPCIVMEYLRGEDLGQRLRRGPLDWNALLRIADQVLSALAVAHNAGIVHRDLKPANIFLSRDDAGRETAKLLDFGLSKCLEGHSHQTTDTRIMGTPSYMSPEQARGKRDELGPKTDIWAMGAILHEMATGQLAYIGASPLQVLYKICNGEPEPLVEYRPDAPPDFVDLLARTLSRDPERRVVSAITLREELHAALSNVASRLTPMHGIPIMRQPVDIRTPSITVHEAEASLNTTESTAFLLTEIIDAVQLWEEYPDAMAPAVERHEAITHEAMVFHGGVICKATGDGVVVAFPSVHAAAAAAIAAQRMLSRIDWGEIKDLEVRMAIHAGRTYERGGNYFGPTLNRGARILALARGGQILLSGAAEEAIREKLPPEVELKDLGIHPLRDLTRPEHIHSLSHPDLKRDIPSRVVPVDVPNNLPHSLSSFVGRKQELAAVRDELRAHRLVTITGLGGSGKTRVALQVAESLKEEFHDGVWLVELAAISEGELLAQTVAQTIELGREGMFTPKHSWLDRLVQHFKDKRILLVWDTCEHIIESCAELAGALLKRCPGLYIIAASREAMSVEGEATLALAPLSSPTRATVEDATNVESVQLFVERARLQRSDFAVTPENVKAICQICQALEGIPLAVELAAARIGTLSVEQLALRLEDRFGLLSSQKRSAAPRQKSLRATLDWSYEHLTEVEQVLLSRLAVFQGSFSLGAAEVVCAGGGVSIVEILDVLSLLAQKSLIRLLKDSGEPRYRLLDTVREYAHEKLEAAGTARKYLSRHRDWCVSLVERAEPGLRGPNQTAYLDELESELDNIRAALKWALDEDEGKETLRVCVALWWFWMGRGHLGEGRRYTEHALQKDVTAAAKYRARALGGCGILVVLADPVEAKRLCEESRALASAAGDTITVALANFGLGWQAAFEGNVEAMVARCTDSRNLYLEAGDTWGAGTASSFLGYALAAIGDREAAERVCLEAIESLNKCGDRVVRSWAYLNFGEVMRIHGSHQQAVEVYQMGLALCRELGDQNTTVIAMTNLGITLAIVGEHLRAESYLRESLAAGESLGLETSVPVILLGLAGVELGRERYLRTARLLGASLRIQETIGGHFAAADQTFYEDVFMRLRTLIDRDLMMAEIKLGEAMSIADARMYAQFGGPSLVP